MSAIIEAIKNQISQTPHLVFLMELTQNGNIFNTEYATKSYFDYCPWNHTLSASPKLGSDSVDPYLEKYLRDQFNGLKTSDFVILTQEDIGEFENPNYEYTVSVIKNSVVVTSMKFNESRLHLAPEVVDLEIKTLATSHGLAHRVFEYQEGDCGESSTVPWRV